MSEFGRIEINPETGLTDENAHHLMAGLENRKQQALALHRALRGDSGVATNSLLVYRCKRRCLLLDIYNTPVGLAFYLPPFKLSPEENVQTDEDARIERTSDGVRRWIERADLLDSIRHPLFLKLNCDHVRRHPVTEAEIRAAVRRAEAEIVV
ncbi:MAG: hypothetical protein ACR2FE_01695 [Aeromicrobium sp.]